MSTPHHSVGQTLRIGVEEVRTRQQSGSLVTMLDVRNEEAWESSPVKIRGAIRIQPAEGHIDPFWPKCQLTVVL
jgi:hypothetical protein